MEERKDLDLLPTVLDYSIFLQQVVEKFSISITAARSRYGQFTYKEWHKLLNVSPNKF
jgi:hypothetical protein